MERFAVVGAGSGGKAVSVDLTLQGKRVRLFEFPEFAANITGMTQSRRLTAVGVVQGTVVLDRVTTDLGEALDGAEVVMEKNLTGEGLAKFREERLNERAASVQGDADRGVTRLSEIADLDERQQVEAFGILVRGSEDYRPGEMAFDGMAADQGALDRTARDAAIRAVLRPDQAEAFDAYQAERRAKAERDMSRLGLTLPDNWDLLEGDAF